MAKSRTSFSGSTRTLRPFEQDAQLTQTWRKMQAGSPDPKVNAQIEKAFDKISQREQEIREKEEILRQLQEELSRSELKQKLSKTMEPAQQRRESKEASKVHTVEKQKHKVESHMKQPEPAVDHKAEIHGSIEFTERRQQQ